MKTFVVPTREEVTPANQEIFDNLKKSLGFVPNLYATMAYSNNGLARFLAYSNARTSLNNKEKEAVNLIVSQLNGCIYCLSAHTAIGKMNGFTDEQILDFRRGKSENPKLNALVQLAGDIIKNKGRASEEVINAFYAQGYTNENLIDVILLISDKTAMNYIHNLTQVPVDFPVAPALSEEPVIMPDECGDTLWDAVLAQHNN
ncbi:carboxymuconolactone decarboxylase family protein [Emticicia sp. C21]|uniref:carboxymuconolactone decarboxylase family protein n=1 Tax=Emticicia sp. C21 TaxID=2302915 RepID=UPI000E35468B|nr:carboxymuconolactone decarboxylase family protein [Emticicia sp. C21]RFS16744.1 carboxymuconolactone decarboxylase family protein [Emticicia sp. C21]